MKRTVEEKREAKRQALQKWRHANPEKARELDRVYRAANPEKRKAKEQRRYQSDIEGQRARARQYRDEHVEQARTACRAWRTNNKGKVAEYNANYMPGWLAANGERLKQYYTDHYEQILARSRLRAARKANAPGKHTPQDIAGLFSRQGGRCAYFATCGHVITKSGRGKFHVDHIEPLRPQDRSRPVGSNNPDNIQLLCQHCNQKKKNRDPYLFTQEYAGRLFPDLPVLVRARKQ